MAVTLVGYPISPFVRKARVALETKRIAYDIDPVVPYTEREKVLKVNPAGTVPVLLQSGSEPITESADIVAWAEKTVPLPSLIPADPEQRARALQVQSYADTHMASVFGGMMFGQRVIVPYYFGKANGREDTVSHAMQKLAPKLLEQLSQVLGQKEFVAGEFSIGDIAASSWLRAATIVGYGIDSIQWPVIHEWLDRCYAEEAYARVIASEEESEPLQWARARYAN